MLWPLFAAVCRSKFRLWLKPTVNSAFENVWGWLSVAKRRGQTKRWLADKRSRWYAVTAWIFMHILWQLPDWYLTAINNSDILKKKWTEIKIFRLYYEMVRDMCKMINYNLCKRGGAFWKHLCKYCTISLRKIQYGNKGIVCTGGLCLLYK